MFLSDSSVKVSKVKSLPRALIEPVVFRFFTPKKAQRISDAYTIVASSATDTALATNTSDSPSHRQWRRGAVTPLWSVRFDIDRYNIHSYPNDSKQTSKIVPMILQFAIIAKWGNHKLLPSSSIDSMMQWSTLQLLRNG